MSLLASPPVAALVADAVLPKLIIVVVLLGLLSYAVVQKLNNKKVESHFAEKNGAVRLAIRNAGFFGIRRFLSLSRSFREHKIMEYVADDFKRYGNQGSGFRVQFQYGKAHSHQKMN
ncbi:hypothetical protein V1505DRAFT_424272 [Lipomyces doorenjongii]